MVELFTGDIFFVIVNILNIMDDSTYINFLIFSNFYKVLACDNIMKTSRILDILFP